MFQVPVVLFLKIFLDNGILKVLVFMQFCTLFFEMYECINDNFIVIVQSYILEGCVALRYQQNGCLNTKT